VPSAYFRAGVIVVVRRADERVLAFERAEPRGQWQLPQGGIHADEPPLDAAWRELEEETGLGTAQVRHAGEHPTWTVQEWPPDVARSGRRLGQVHRWFFFEVIDGDVEPVPDGDEFVAWRWVEAGWLVDQIIEFKHASYEQVLGCGELRR
jgi:putative (di)nucleoside polyphosphate hydrolase